MRKAIELIPGSRFQSPHGVLQVDSITVVDHLSRRPKLRVECRNKVGAKKIVRLHYDMSVTIVK